MRTDHRFLLCGAIAASAFIANGAAAAPPAHIAMFRGDPALTGVADAPAPRGLLGVRFRFRAGGPIRSTPALAGGTLYFGSDDGNFYALDARTGALRWRLAVGAGIASSPSIVDGTVFFTAWDGKLYAVKAASGSVRWKADLGRDLGNMNYWDFYTSSPTPFDGTLYVGSGDGHVYAVDPATGRIRWSHDTGARVRGTPAVTDRHVVVGTMDGHVVAMDRRTGAAQWRFATDGAGYTYERKKNDTTALPASPAIHDNVVTIGARDGNIYAIDLETGAKRWKTTHDGGSWILSTTIQGSTVFVGSGSAAIVQSAKLADGSENWRAKISGAAFGPLAVAGDVLVADDFGGNIHAFDTAGGRELWHFALGDRIFGGVLIGDGAVFVGADDGELVALDTSAAAMRPATRLAVYAEPGPAAGQFEWFQNGIDRAVFSAFGRAGYAMLDDAALAAAIDDQIEGRASIAIVFADGHIPRAIGEDKAGPPLLRRFLDAGGIAVFVAHNPLALRYGADGTISDIDNAAADKDLGLVEMAHPLDYGYHVSQYTAEGKHWGLDGVLVTSGAIEPAQVSTVLATDRIGYATAWAKSYAKGGLVLQIPMPLNRMVDIAPFRAAIDHAIAHGPGR
jgi:outer membrane protein assembly factor BamB